MALTDKMREIGHGRKRPARVERVRVKGHGYGIITILGITIAGRPL